MLRDDIRKASIGVISAIQASKLSDVIPRDMTPQMFDKTDSKIAIATALQTFSNYAQSFDENEKFILKVLELDFLLDATTWVALLSPSSERSPADAIWRVRTAVSFAQKFIPLLIKIISRESQPTPTADTSTKSEIGRDTIVLIVKDTENPSLTAKHVSEIMLSTQILYDAVSRYMEIKPLNLIVEHADSGSNKSFSFKGVAAAIEETRKLLVEYWDRKRLSPDGFNPSKARAISDGLDVVERIQSLGQNGALSPEEREKIKREILGSLSNLIANNAVPKEILDKHPPTIRELPVDRPKLLTYDDVAPNKENPRSQESRSAKASDRSPKKPTQKPKRTKD